MNKILLIALASSMLISCSNIPTRVSADDIPEWCTDIEKTGIFSNLVPEILTGKRLLACGSGAENDISSSRVKATIDAKKQILDQLVGRLIKKYSESRLVANYKDYVGYSSFGYEIIEQKVFNIEGGYQTFVLIETALSDLTGTQKAILKPRFNNSKVVKLVDK